MSHNQVKMNDKAFARQIQQPRLKVGYMPSNNYVNHQGYPPGYPNLNPYPDQNNNIDYGQSRNLNNPYLDPYNLPTVPITGGTQRPTVVVINKTQNQGICQYCGSNASTIQRKRSGCAIWSWCTVLFLFTGVCCWIPFVVDDCYDLQYICTKCQQVRGVIKSPYGC